MTTKSKLEEMVHEADKASNFVSYPWVTVIDSTNDNSKNTLSY